LAGEAGLPFGLVGSGLRSRWSGVGAWAAGGDEWGGQNEKDSIDAIQQAIACGVNWVDTAPTYGLGFSEELFGRAIAQLASSERPMLFTKCSPSGARMVPYGATCRRHADRPLLKSTAIVHGVEDPTCFGLDPPMLAGASAPWITAACEVHRGQGRIQRRGRVAVART